MTHLQSSCELNISRALSSAVWAWMVDDLYHTYASKLNDVRVWEADFPDMAQRLVAEGSLFPNCIGFLNGHFQRICRPLGTVSLHQSLPAERFYNGYEKAFGLKYIALVLANGIVLAWGPWTGNNHDAPLLSSSGVIQQLREVYARTGRVWMLYGDSAFGVSRFFQRQLRGVQRRQPGGKRYNKIMGSLRTSIENVFAEIYNQFRHFGYHRELKVGSQALGREFVVAVFLHNCQGILMGNQASARFGQHHLAALTLSDLLDKAV